MSVPLHPTVLAQPITDEQSSSEDCSELDPNDVAQTFQLITEAGLMANA